MSLDSLLMNINVQIHKIENDSNSKCLFANNVNNDFNMKKNLRIIFLHIQWKNNKVIKMCKNQAKCRELRNTKIIIKIDNF